MLMEGQPQSSMPLGGHDFGDTSGFDGGSTFNDTLPPVALAPVPPTPAVPETSPEEAGASAADAGGAPPTRGTTGDGEGAGAGADGDRAAPTPDINLELTSAADWGVNDTLSPVRTAVVPAKVSVHHTATTRSAASRC